MGSGTALSACIPISGHLFSQITATTPSKVDASSSMGMPDLAIVECEWLLTCR